ncbi:hypothetical protein [Mycoplasmopsis alligatoris]|uniref:Phage tail component, N-terminal domain protein n=1 Tax=Mycoplasmopsis alligatoris A21JP2 TaxID=747682 RepID=D4XWC6_9BACT|nr:hypothetical protein [Mycoplasmopsis alligatoris]EFF41144.1 phage tail component, N-terminal domain protein [Mycoplasmopsis alligatoris A21JP2]
MKKNILLTSIIGATIVPVSFALISCNVNLDNKDNSKVENNNNSSTNNDPKNPVDNGNTNNKPTDNKDKNPGSSTGSDVNKETDKKISIPATKLKPGITKPRVVEEFKLDKVEVVSNFPAWIPSEHLNEAKTEILKDKFIVNNLASGVVFTNKLLDFNDKSGEIIIDYLFKRENANLGKKTFTIKVNKMPLPNDLSLFVEGTSKKIPENYKLNSDSKLDDLKKYVNISLRSIDGVSEAVLKRYQIEFIDTKVLQNNLLQLNYKIKAPSFYTFSKKDGEEYGQKSNIKSLTLEIENEINAILSKITINNNNQRNNVTASYLLETYKNDTGNNTLRSRFVNGGLIIIPEIPSKKVYSPEIVAVEADDLNGKLTIQFHLKDSSTEYSNVENSSVRILEITGFKKVKPEFSNTHDDIQNKFYIDYGTQAKLKDKLKTIPGFTNWYENDNKIEKLSPYNGGYKPNNLFNLWFNKINADVLTEKRELSLQDESRPIYEIIEVNKEKINNKIKISLKVKVYMHIYGYTETEFITTISFFKN